MADAAPIFRWSQVPVLLAQAVQVRRGAVFLPEPPGPREAVAGSGPLLRVLIAGDSSAAGVGADHQDRALAGQLAARLGGRFTVDWWLRARTGYRTADTLSWLASMPARPFDVAVIALGVNDVTGLVRRRRFAEDQATLTRLLRDKFGVRLQLRSGLPPMERFPLLPAPLCDVLGARARQFDAVLAGMQAADVRHVPFDPARLSDGMIADDGFHPGPAVYAMWAEALARQIADWADAGGTTV